MKRNVIVDTSVFMEGTDELLEKLKLEYQLVVPLIVVDELDDLKDNKKEFSKSQKARRGIKFIEAYYDELEFGLEEEQIKTIKHDNIIIALALSRKCPILTFDVGMKVRARQRNIEIVETIGGEDINNAPTQYKGYKIFNVETLNDTDQEILSQIYNNENVLDMVTNEYLIIKHKSDGITIDIKRWTGSKFVDLINPRPTKINPANDLQRCAIDLLLNPEITVKGVFGAAGCGKTYLATKIAVHQMKIAEKFDRILCIREVVGPGSDIGFIPGTKDEKIGDFFKPIIQHLDNGQVEALDLIQKGKLEYEIPKFMKGLDIQNTYIYVDEAEDLCPAIVKLLGTRVSRGSCIVFTGDSSQAEPKYKDNNGIMELIKRSRGHEIAGYIVLEEDLRSEASKMFAEIF